MTVVFSTDPESSSPSPTLEKQWEGEGVWEETKAGGTAGGHLGIGSKEGGACFPQDRSQECFQPEGEREGKREGG